MSKHGLTRVTFRGDKTIVVAGAIPDSFAVRGLTEELVSIEPQSRPGTAKTFPKPPVLPARVPKAAVIPTDAKPQAELPPAAKETK